MCLTKQAGNPASNWKNLSGGIISTPPAVRYDPLPGSYSLNQAGLQTHPLLRGTSRMSTYRYSIRHRSRSRCSRDRPHSSANSQRCIRQRRTIPHSCDTQRSRRATVLATKHVLRTIGRRERLVVRIVCPTLSSLRIHSNTIELRMTRLDKSYLHLFSVFEIPSSHTFS